MRNITENSESSVAPRAMKITRSTSAATMPTVSTFCWCSSGTANVVMMTTKTKRLSTERLFSTVYPAKYSPPNPHPATVPSTTPKAIATAM